mmetsp:Transcript_36426/g.72539  ORF Transcript_36426/g.72539 Transcript_36426/m.72539 type:complete len:208 (+) Transcript_36426:412-1035(+)
MDSSDRASSERALAPFCAWPSAPPFAARPIKNESTFIKLFTNGRVTGFAVPSVPCQTRHPSQASAREPMVQHNVHCQWHCLLSSRFVCSRLHPMTYICNCTHLQLTQVLVEELRQRLLRFLNAHKSYRCVCICITPVLARPHVQLLRLLLRVMPRCTLLGCASLWPCLCIADHHDHDVLRNTLGVWHFKVSCCCIAHRHNHLPQCAG